MFAYKSCLRLISCRTLSFIPLRPYSTHGKEMTKFYKRVSISQGEAGYEINLDTRKLKTPLGKFLSLPTEPLALAVASEWDSQEDTIKRHAMHLTSLCNSATDNVTGRDKNTIINTILNYLETDTICYRSSEPEDFVQVQAEHWDALIFWLKDRYNVVVEPTWGLDVPNIPSATVDLFRKHLESFNDWALIGYEQAVENLKSLIIAFALIDREITVDRAVHLSRLEQEFQVAKWGNVEWHHDVDLQGTTARTAAATLFVHLNTQNMTTGTKFRKANS